MVNEQSSTDLRHRIMNRRSINFEERLRLTRLLDRLSHEEREWLARQLSSRRRRKIGGGA